MIILYTNDPFSSSLLLCHPFSLPPLTLILSYLPFSFLTIFTLSSSSYSLLLLLLFFLLFTFFPPSLHLSPPLLHRPLLPPPLLLFLLLLLLSEEPAKKRRRSRWGSEATKTAIPGLPTVLPANMTEQQQKIYLCELWCVCVRVCVCVCVCMCVVASKACLDLLNTLDSCSKNNG